MRAMPLISSQDRPSNSRNIASITPQNNSNGKLNFFSMRKNPPQLQKDLLEGKQPYEQCEQPDFSNPFKTRHSSLVISNPINALSPKHKNGTGSVKPEELMISLRANDILQANTGAPKQSPFYYSNRDLLTKGIGQHARGI
jgi:hypothetical protein